ncbi:hypothetical protein C2G38_2040560 [Gigaspora rosea]|uniref:Uncharacterized protein n=1 Tax=Gigaspora rosea TaxID=44941 RepID=A0A397V218_9GLOM|nr:hypothetical protein C2G38_2040560 [Gigaspora rosea]
MEARVHYKVITPSPTINNLILKASLEGTFENKARMYKPTARKYPTIDYDANQGNPNNPRLPKPKSHQNRANLAIVGHELDRGAENDRNTPTEAKFEQQIIENNSIQCICKPSRIHTKIPNGQCKRYE